MSHEQFARNQYLLMGAFRDAIKGSGIKTEVAGFYEKPKRIFKDAIAEFKQNVLIAERDLWKTSHSNLDESFYNPVPFYSVSARCLTTLANFVYSPFILEKDGSASKKLNDINGEYRYSRTTDAIAKELGYTERTIDRGLATLRRIRLIDWDEIYFQGAKAPQRNFTVNLEGILLFTQKEYPETSKVIDYKKLFNYVKPNFNRWSKRVILDSFKVSQQTFLPPSSPDPSGNKDNKEISDNYSLDNSSKVSDTSKQELKINNKIDLSDLDLDPKKEQEKKICFNFDFFSFANSSNESIYLAKESDFSFFASNKGVSVSLSTIALLDLNPPKAPLVDFYTNALDLNDCRLMPKASGLFSFVVSKSVEIISNAIAFLKFKTPFTRKERKELEATKRANWQRKKEFSYPVSKEELEAKKAKEKATRKRKRKVKGLKLRTDSHENAPKTTQKSPNEQKVKDKGKVAKKAKKTSTESAITLKSESAIASKNSEGDFLNAIGTRFVKIETGNVEMIVNPDLADKNSPEWEIASQNKLLLWTKDFLRRYQSQKEADLEFRRSSCI